MKKHNCWNCETGEYFNGIHGGPTPDPPEPPYFSCRHYPGPIFTYAVDEDEAVGEFECEHWLEYDDRPERE